MLAIAGGIQAQGQGHQLGIRQAAQGGHRPRRAPLRRIAGRQRGLQRTAIGPGEAREEEGGVRGHGAALPGRGLGVGIEVRIVYHPRAMKRRRMPLRSAPGGGLRIAAGAAALLLAAACSLDMQDLPENRFPVVGEIAMDPPPAALAPLGSFTLSVEATDPDEDPLRYSWSANNQGSWLGNIANADSVVWLAPASFAGIDSVRFSVQVRDLDDDSPVTRRLAVPVIERSGSLRVSIVDLAGAPVAMPLAVLGVDTLETPASEHHFAELSWGEKILLAFATASHQGASPPGATPVFAGYPDTLFIHPDIENQLTLTVAPTSLLLLPGVHAGALYTELQAAVDYCAGAGVDSLLLWRSSYALAHQELPGGGSAALRLDAADLLLAPFPGRGPVTIDAAQGDNKTGIYLAGRSGATRLLGLVITGASEAGIALDGSSLRLADTRIADCGGPGIFVEGAAGDSLILERCVVQRCAHGVSMAGGSLEAEGILVAQSGWYGLWLRQGARGRVAAATLVESAVAGAFFSGAGAFAVERSLLAGGSWGFFVQSGSAPQLDCNLLWDNGAGDYGGLAPGASDLAADPLFCDPDAGDWRVEAASPALGGACGGIGAFDNCESDPLLPVEGF